MRCGRIDGEEVRDVNDLDEVVSYLRSRGLAPRKDHGRILEILLQLPHKHSCGRVSVASAAKGMYMARRTLARQCAVAGLPTPQRILGFGRVLATLHFMRRSGHQMSRATEETGWPDPFSFSNAVARLTGLRPSIAREKGLLYVAEAWVQKELSEGNLVLREPEPPPCPCCGRPLAMETDSA